MSDSEYSISRYNKRVSLKLCPFQKVKGQVEYRIALFAIENNVFHNPHTTRPMLNQYQTNSNQH